MTYDEEIQRAIDFLSSHTVRSSANGESYCSASDLVKCSGPTFSQKLYIDRIGPLLGGSGTAEDANRDVINILGGLGVRRTPQGWGLVAIDQPDQWIQLFIAELQG